MLSYAITDPKYYGGSSKEIESSVKKLIDKDIASFICFRDKTAKEYKTLAESFILTCKSSGFFKMLLHSDVELSHRLKAYGVHLTSSQFHLIKKAKEYGLFCVISTHSEDEIYKALKLGADAVTYSPIFFTPDKAKPKGLEDLNEKVAKINIKIIALGGIVSDEDVAKIKSTDAYAFASIRYFIK
jgi:thiamine-phosphate pyrophosphorylase